jgi:hypothetical protein
MIVDSTAVVCDRAHTLMFAAACGNSSLGMLPGLLDVFLDLLLLWIIRVSL